MNWWVKAQNIYTTLYYIENVLFLASTITGSISISALASLFGVSIEIISSAIRLKICAMTWEINKLKSIIKEKKEAW